MRFLVSYISTAVVFCLLDFAWLGLVAPTFYKSQLGALLLDKPNLWPALVFYALYVVGLVVFCVMPAIDGESWTKAAMLGALFGFCAYATYDLSNLATLKDWSTAVTVVDMGWGAIVSALAATGGYFGSNILSRWLA
jgi:uncharacterized membrane protein